MPENEIPKALSAQKANFTDRWVVIGERFMPEIYKGLKERLFFATGGFGCTYGLHGQKVFGYHIDGLSTQYQRGCIERFASDEEIAELTVWTETTELKVGDTVPVKLYPDKPAINSTVDEINRGWCRLKIPVVHEDEPDSNWHTMMDVEVEDITKEGK